jgi:hypothetical protein
MADGINIEGGFDDIDLTSDFLDGTVRGVLLQFASKLQTDLRKSIDSKGYNNKGLNNSMNLAQSLAVDPNIVEYADKVVYSLEYPIYGDYQDEGVSGTEEAVQGSRFKFDQSSKPPFGAMIKWANTKFGLTIPQGMTKTGFGMAAAYNKKRFGIKPTYWLRDVITDGRIEALEEQLGKSIAFAIIERA